MSGGASACRTSQCPSKTPHKSDQSLITDIRQKFGASDVLTRGLQHRRRVPVEEPVRSLSCSEGQGDFLTLHHSGRVRFYQPNGRLRESSVHSSLSVSYQGLIYTPLPGRLLGWGPGATLTLLDSQLQPLRHAVDPPDIKVCQVIAGTDQLVSAGCGNVCLWCLGHLVTRVRVLEGFNKHSDFTQLAVAPGGACRGPRALAVCDTSVTVLDLTEGRVLDHKTNLHLRRISSLLYCPLLEAVITASEDANIRVWGPDWQLIRTFVGHSAAVTSLLMCPESGLLVSSSLDGTLSCWSLHTGDHVQSVSAGADPPLSLAASSGTFCSFSRSALDFWTFNKLYQLHCKLGGDSSAPVRQILAPPTQPPLPARVLCVYGDSNVALVAGETGAVLTVFRANSRVRCADHCVYKEILLVLTEEGVVIRASTLTNPVTLLDEQRADWPIDKENDKVGVASCMVLYSKISDPQEALEEWRSIQQRGVQTQKQLHDDKNRFLVMLGHRGGYISLMQMHSGKTEYTVSAHNGQDITIIQAYPEQNLMITAGEDYSVLLWSVSLCAQECVSVCVSVLCEHTPVCVSLLDSVLSINLQQPNSTCSLIQYNINTHTHTEHPAEEEHNSTITGLCVCEELGVLASCSLDGLVCIWDEQNRLIRTLQLNTECECVEFRGQTGDLLLGIRGDLYRIHSSHTLPPDLQPWLLCNEDLSDSVSDPLLCKHSWSVRSTVSQDERERQEVIKHPDLEPLMLRNRDLISLKNGETTSNKHIRPEAFSHHIRRLYNQNLHVNISDDDLLDLQAAHLYPKPPKLPHLPPLTPPTLTQGFFPNPDLAKKLHTTHIQEDRLDTRLQVRLGFIPNSVLVGQLWPDVSVENDVLNKPWKLRDLNHNTEETEQFFISEEDKHLDLTFPVETPPKPANPPQPSPPPKNIKYTLKPPKPLPPIEQTPPPKPVSPPKPITPSPSPPKPITPSPSPPKPITPSPSPPKPITPSPSPPKPITPSPSPPKPITPSPSPPKPITPSPSPPKPITPSPSPPKPITPSPSPPKPITPSPSPPKPITPSPSPSPPKPITPSPSPPKPASPPSPHTPSPQLPFFLQPFVQEKWFSSIYPDWRCVPECVTEAEFCAQLLDVLQVCSVDQKLRVLRAIITSHTHLQNTHLLTHTLLNSLHTCLHNHRSDDEQRFVEELLNFLVCVNPHSYDVTVELISLLADKQLKLQTVAACMLQVLGVDDVQTWFPPQLEFWDTEAHQETLREKCKQWLNSWTDQYKLHKHLQLPESSKSNSDVSPVEVLRYFCWLQRQRQPTKPPQEGRRDTVLLDTQTCRLKAVQRLGETHSMSRVREPQGLWLPPLPSRPLLMGFTRHLSLPLSTISLSPFPFSLSSHCRKELSPRRYFLLERSYVHYYK